MCAPYKKMRRDFGRFSHIMAENEANFASSGKIYIKELTKGSNNIEQLFINALFKKLLKKGISNAWILTIRLLE
jgi:hypothetical protein